MTIFNGVRRVTAREHSVLSHKPRRIVATLAQGDLITLRESGRRHSWSVPVEKVFRDAVRRNPLPDQKRGEQ